MEVIESFKDLTEMDTIGGNQILLNEYDPISKTGQIHIKGKLTSLSKTLFKDKNVTILSLPDDINDVNKKTFDGLTSLSQDVYNVSRTILYKKGNNDK